MIQNALFLLWDFQDIHDLSNNNIKDSINQLTSGEKAIFNKIIKIAKCHGSIRNFIKKYSFTSTLSVHHRNSDHELTTHPQLYIQSLSEGLDEVLQPYRSHIEKLENTAQANPYFSLCYILGSLENFKGVLYTLNKIVTNIEDKKLRGCQLLQILQQNALSGNEETAVAIRILLQTVHKVFYRQLCDWLLYGNLRDPSKEFFIEGVENDTLLPSPAFGASKLSSLNSNEQASSKSGSINYESNNWSDYEIKPLMLPSYIPLSMAQKILFIGKSVVLFDSSPADTNASSVNLLSLNMRCTVWGEKEPQFLKAIQELKNMDSFSINKLDIFIDEVKLCVTEHLWVVAAEEAEVLHELQLMKDYFLLGRGELFLELLRIAEPLLNSPPTALSTRDFNQAFHTAARAVFLGNSKDIEKFTFNIPYNKNDSSSSDIAFGILDGWSTVVLNYQVRWPLHLIFSPDILQCYNEMFRFLLRVKKTQHDLHLLWYTYKQTNRHGASVWQLHNKLMFLMDNLQHYLQVDVLESNFSKLKQEAEKIKDFELLKKAHSAFLVDTLSQAFLLMNPLSEDSMEKEEYPDYRSNPVMSNVIEVLQLCNSFCSMANETTDHDDENYHIIGYTNRFEILVGKLLQMLTALRTQPCGTHLARFLMRLDFNRWFSSTAHLTQSVTCIL